MSKRFILRAHQAIAVEEAEAAIAFGSREVIISLPTGSGKSAVIAELARVLPGKIVISVTFTPLIDQIAEHLKLLNVDFSILKAGREAEFEENHRVQLVMAQTYYARLDKLSLNADFLIPDEYHVSYMSKRSIAIIEKLNPSCTIGLSATPYDSKGFALSDTEDFIQPTSMRRLTEQGYLSPLRFLVPKWSENIDYSSVKSNGGDYTLSALDEIIGANSHIELIVDSMNKINARNKKTLVFCSTIEHCELVTTALKKDGYAAEAYHSKVNNKNIEGIMYAFKTNQQSYIDINEQKDKDLFSDEISIPKRVRCLVSVSKLSIGFDVKDIQLGVMLRPTKVKSLFVQMSGRAARGYPGKLFAEILDLGQLLSKHGFPEEEYIPPIKTGVKSVDAEALRKANKDLSLLNIFLTSDEPTEVTQKFYDIKVEEVKRTEEAILKNTKSYLDTLEPAQKFVEMGKALMSSRKIENVIAIGAEMWTFWYGTPISKAGRPYNFNHEWLAEDAVRIFNKYPEKYNKWLAAHKTRIKNLLANPANVKPETRKNYNSIKFFSKFLLETYQSELDMQAHMLGAVTKTNREDSDTYVDRRANSNIDIDIDIDEIPF